MNAFKDEAFYSESKLAYYIIDAQLDSLNKY